MYREDFGTDSSHLEPRGFLKRLDKMVVGQLEKCHASTSKVDHIGMLISVILGFVKLTEDELNLSFICSA
jgi:hypothetical protein